MVSAQKTIDVTTMSMPDRVEYVVKRGAELLPLAVGRELLTLIEPRSLAIMVGVFTIWAGAQFFGIGEIADTIILVGGWVLFGGVAIRAAELDFQAGRLTVSATNIRQLDLAAEKLAASVKLIGVQATLAILLDKPGNAFKKQFFADGSGDNPAPWAAFKGFPKNRWWGYAPTTEGSMDPELGPGTGSTSPTGDIVYSMRGSDTDRRMALAHEQVHQFLTPKLQFLRQLRTFVNIQGYNRSYLLRYIEEAMAETVAQVRVRGLTKANLIEGLRFPVGRDYDISVGDIKSEVKQIFLGPITVGGMTYQVWASRRPVRRERKSR